ncbi:DinB family protein [Lederbergia lenta]|uniref:DinB family protein n=1 Tax=Lederbergia lenta TaxID=1467 RepID=UPI002041987C|nr:DinB family protein [Lederbergia lenta]MCM3112476.1 DinB family protein [Lederbergia lenta]
MDENKQIREDVLKSVSGLSDKQLNERVEDGSWTIMQVLDHLYLMERTIVHAITDQLANGENKSVDEKPIQLTTNRSTKVDAPSFVIPSDDFITLEEMGNKLSESRAALTNIVHSTDRALLEQRAYPHPMFGELSLQQWIPFVGLHEKRHLAQIEKLKEKLG